MSEHALTKETVIELDKKKQVTVHTFKDVPLVDIREFYVDSASGDRKPGRRGIALTEAVWKKLLEHKDEILAALDELKDAKKPKIESDDQS